MPQPAHLRELNPQQLDAVTSLQGALLILAGAGSGKTRVLTRRVAHLLHTGVPPHRILAVTFTNKAASEMKERVVDLAGDQGGRVWISTFHSSCARILRQDIEPLDFTRHFAIYDDDDQRRLVKQLVKEAGYDPKVHPPRALLSRIDWYKNRMQDPDAVVEEGRARPGDALLRVWRAYEEALKASNALDFNDLIGHAVRLLEQHEGARRRWQQRFRYVLVDEYQDTNAGQYRLLKALVAEHGNLAVVGDDDQSIYGFRGADIRNILDFERDFPSAKVIRLEQNYRSTSHILDLANQVVARNEGRIAKKLWTKSEPGAKVGLVVVRTPGEEAARVVQMLQNLARRGYAWEDMAIIYRTNATSRPFEQSLRRTAIPYRVVGARKFYERREIRDALAYVRLAANPADDAALARVINVPSRSIGAKTMEDLRATAADLGVPLLEAARDLGQRGTSKRHKALFGFHQLMAELAREVPSLEPWELVRRVLERTGYLAQLEAEDTDEARDRLANLQELMRDASESVEGMEGTALDRLHAWLDRAALAGQDEEHPPGGMVSLLTVHNAKGLEYPVVFVAHMVEGQFPHSRSSEDPSEVEEERRLAYVAFTRARERLYVTRHRVAPQWGDRGRASERLVQPSRFLFDLPASACEGKLPTVPSVASARGGEAHPARTRLDAFVRHRGSSSRRGPVPAPPTAEEHTLVDLEDPSQLQVGGRVFHPRHGVGVIRRVLGSGSRIQLRIAFVDSLRLLPVAGSDLQIVVE